MTPARATPGRRGSRGASFLLYLGVTLCAQYYVVYRRAAPLWAQLGPDAGRPLGVQFMQAPGAFFASFTGPMSGGPAGWGRAPSGTGTGAAGAGAAGYADDPNIIDAEVVEDDDDHGPPELHTPR